MTKRWSNVILAGPTGIGKTALSIPIAEHLGIPVISADSRQCYRYLDIGTGKIDSETRKRVPHFNIDLLNPDERDNARAFAERSEIWENEIREKNGITFYVGGSTLHLQTLVWPMDELPESSEMNQAELLHLEETEGIDALLKKLQNADPDYAKAMQGYNRQRIFRALDVWMQTGKPFSSFHSQTEFKVPEDVQIFVLTASRETINRRIEERVNLMVSSGLLAETRDILGKGYSPELQSLQTVGYKEMIAFLHGNITLDDAVLQMKATTKQYAKRQLTWFRRWQGVEWIDLDKVNLSVAEKHILAAFRK